MLEMGRSKWIPVRKGKEVVRVNGETQKRLVNETVVRVTRDAYGHNRKYTRKLVVELGGGDTVTIRPLGMRAPGTKVTATVYDIYRMIINRRAFTEMAQKRAEKLAKQKAAKERRNIAAADKRIRLKARENRAR